MKLDIGHFSLMAAWALSVYALIAGSIGAIRKDKRFTFSARNAVFLTAIFSVLSLLALGSAFYNHDYHYAYVWRTSNNDMPWMYLISAIWGGMDGSMQLWATFTAVYAALCLYFFPKRSEGTEPFGPTGSANLETTVPVIPQIGPKGSVPSDLFSFAVPILGLAVGFFLTVVAFLTNPFRTIPIEANPVDGNGLNPLLQNPSMMIHPPSLYLGFTGFVVPFAFAVAALISGQGNWIPLIRRWTLIAWGFLSAGIVLGGNWAYIELGWGGFWAWDPVENASFLPWLAATAFVHSVMVEEHRDTLKIWNLFLAILAYVLTVFGTFLTRSGVVQSVHAFAEGGIGWIFITYLTVISVGSIALLIYRRKTFRGKNSIESYLSREAIFLYNNLILLGICFSTLWGVMFPVLSEAIVGEKSVVGPPFYNQVNGPLFLCLLFFMGIGPLVAWKQSTFGAILKKISYPLIPAFIAGVITLVYAPGETRAALAFALTVFIATSTLLEMEIMFRKGRAPLPGFNRSKSRRFGGMVVHFGVAIIGFAIASSSIFKIEKDFVISPGQTVEIGRYQLKLNRLKEENYRNFQSIVGTIEVLVKGKEGIFATLNPERRFYPRSQEVTTEVDIHMGAREDLYVALSGLGEKGEAILKVFVNPLQIWLWIGAVVMLLGAAIVIIPGSRVEKMR